MKRTESMFWREFFLENRPYNCTNTKRYDELLRQVVTAPVRAHNIKDDVKYKYIVNLAFILTNLEWGLSL